MQEVVTYIIIGFPNYTIKDKILYRKSFVIKTKDCNYQYRDERKIKRTVKDGSEGYFLVKNNKRKFYSLKKLRHKLKLFMIS